jgi:hypothetical protein
LPPVDLPLGQAVIVPAAVPNYVVRADQPSVLLRSMPPAR